MKQFLETYNILKFFKKTFFHATGITESHERVIFEQKRGQFHAAEFWENFPILVPPLVPSELRFCRIINVSYEIRVNFICFLFDFPVTR